MSKYPCYMSNLYSITTRIVCQNIRPTWQPLFNYFRNWMSKYQSYMSNFSSITTRIVCQNSRTPLCYVRIDFSIPNTWILSAKCDFHTEHSYVKCELWFQYWTPVCYVRIVISILNTTFVEVRQTHTYSHVKESGKWGSGDNLPCNNYTCGSSPFVQWQHRKNNSQFPFSWPHNCGSGPRQNNGHSSSTRD